MKIEVWKGRSLEGIPAMKLDVNGFRVAGRELTEKSGLQRIALFDVNKEDFANAIRRALLVVTAVLFFIGCGGAEFSAIQQDSTGDGGVNVQANADASGGDSPISKVDSGGSGGEDSGATKGGTADSAATLDSGSGGDTAPIDSGFDAACATIETTKVACNGVLEPYPTNLCAVLVSQAGGSAYAALSTPTACNTWCTISCACLAANSPCRIGATMTTCQVGADGVTLQVECKAE